MLFNPYVDKPEFSAAVEAREDDRPRLAAAFIDRIDDDDESQDQFALRQLLERGHLKAMRPSK